MILYDIMCSDDMCTSVLVLCISAYDAHKCTYYITLYVHMICAHVYVCTCVFVHMMYTHAHVICTHDLCTCVRVYLCICAYCVHMCIICTYNICSCVPVHTDEYLNIQTYVD